MIRSKMLVAVSMVALAFAGSTPANAVEDTTTGTTSDTVGFIAGCVRPSLPRVSDTSEDRWVCGWCFYRVDTTTGNDVLMTVRGIAIAGGRPRATGTEIQCVIINSLGATVFNLTRSESGPVAPLAGAVVIRNNGPYTICARADAKYDDGEDVYWPTSNTLACILP